MPKTTTLMDAEVSSREPAERRRNELTAAFRVITKDSFCENRLACRQSRRSLRTLALNARDISVRIIKAYRLGVGTFERYFYDAS